MGCCVHTLVVFWVVFVIIVIGVLGVFGVHHNVAFRVMGGGFLLAVEKGRAVAGVSGGHPLASPALRFPVSSGGPHRSISAGEPFGLRLKKFGIVS